jgi:hypothetical protein
MMSFIKNLFGKNETFVPTPTQVIPGLDPIVVQVIEILFPSSADQKYVFQYAIRYKEKFNDKSFLSLIGVLASCDGNPKFLQDLESDVFKNGTFWADISIDYPQFNSVKSLQKWIKSKQS